MRTFIVLSLLAGMAFAGCMVGPAYKPPRMALSGAFGETNRFVNTNEPVADWWKEFHDAELNRLVTAALDSNYDIQIAGARIRESRYQRNIVAADLFPQVDADASYIHARGSKNVLLPLAGGGQGGVGGAQSGASKSNVRSKMQSANTTGGGDNYGGNPLSYPPNPFGKGGLPGATTDLYQAGFDANWEIDVYGGKRREVQAANAEFQAAVENRRAAQVSIAAETARDYLELRGAQERMRIARENIAAQTEILRLTESQYHAGLASDLDVVRARAELDQTASTLPPLEADVRGMIHALSILVAKEPNSLSAELSSAVPAPGRPPAIPIGLPSELLRRRPDIRQAERACAAANARIGAAVSDLFPKFALVGSAGLDASQPGNLINWDSRYFLISPTVAWRIFDAGRIMSNIRLQKADEQEATLQYQNTILKALSEVEDALIGYASEQARQNQLAEETAQNREALALARQRYDRGLANFLDVLDAERNLLASQDALAQSDTALSTGLVAVYKSLGGGWN